MKRLFTFLSILSIVLLGCKGQDGEPGPAGLNGKDGNNGNNADTTLIFDGGWIEGIVNAQRLNNSVVQDTILFALPDAVFIPSGNNLSVTYWNSYADRNSDYNKIFFTINNNDWTIQPINSEFVMRFKIAIDIGGGDLFIASNVSGMSIGSSNISNWTVSSDKKLSFDVTIPQNSTIQMENGKSFYGTFKVRNVPIHSIVTRLGVQ